MKVISGKFGEDAKNDDKITIKKVVEVMVKHKMLEDEESDIVVLIKNEEYTTVISSLEKEAFNYLLDDMKFSIFFAEDMEDFD